MHIFENIFFSENRANGFKRNASQVNLAQDDATIYGLRLGPWQTVCVRVKVFEKVAAVENSEQRK